MLISKFLCQYTCIRISCINLLVTKCLYQTTDIEIIIIELFLPNSYSRLLIKNFLISNRISVSEYSHQNAYVGVPIPKSPYHNTYIRIGSIYVRIVMIAVEYLSQISVSEYLYQIFVSATRIGVFMSECLCRTIHVREGLRIVSNSKLRDRITPRYVSSVSTNDKSFKKNKAIVVVRAVRTS